MKYEGEFISHQDYNIGIDNENKISYILDKNLNILKEIKDYCVCSWHLENTLFVNGFARSHNFIKPLEYPSKWHLINEEFNLVNTKPYDFINYSWVNKYLRVGLDGKFGYVDINNQFKILPVIEEIIGDCDKDQNCHLNIKINTLWGKLDFRLKELIPVKYKTITDVYGNYSEYAINENGKYFTWEETSIVEDINGMFGIYYIEQIHSNPVKTFITFTGCIYESVIDYINLIFMKNNVTYSIEIHGNVLEETNFNGDIFSVFEPNIASE